MYISKNSDIQKSLMINVLADQYLYNIRSYLPENINLQLFDPVKGLPSEISEAHGLLIRTVIPINKQTLPHIPKNLSFMASGSAGTNHVDTHYLQQHGISFAHAPGCNAHSVAEYVATALLMWAENQTDKIADLSAGIIGVGHVGSQVIELLNNLGVDTLSYDPPRENRDSHFTSADLSRLLDCDMLSFHTPLTKEGDYPTYHWLNSQKLANRAFDLIINTSRGGVIEEKALLQAKAKKKVGDIIIDVWENEPQINPEIAKQAFIKTPHIAGYSIQAKRNASRIVAEALINHFSLPEPDTEKSEEPRMVNKDITEFNSLSALLAELHPIRKYEAKLKTIMGKEPAEREKAFNKLRAEFPLRREFSQTYLPPAYFDRFPALRKLGFPLLSDLK